MIRQPGHLQPAEVVDALLHPDHIRWSDDHQSWMWVGERVAVCAHAHDGHTTIRTVLWADEDLWVNNPRPEKR